MTRPMKYNLIHKFQKNLGFDPQIQPKLLDIEVVCSWDSVGMHGLMVEGNLRLQVKSWTVKVLIM